MNYSHLRFILTLDKFLIAGDGFEPPTSCTEPDELPDCPIRAVIRLVS